MNKNNFDIQEFANEILLNCETCKVKEFSNHIYSK